MNVVLVGFMGSGKTAVGRRIAQRLGYAFLDMDRFIEAEAGCTIADLFEYRGEPYFRALESGLAKHLHKLTNHVISTGGGILTSPGNLEQLKAAGVTVFLNADRGELLERLGRDTRRPKLKGGELRETVERLLNERMPQYQQAELSIDTKGKSLNRVAGEIIATLAGHAKGDEPPAEPEPVPEEEQALPSGGEQPEATREEEQATGGEEAVAGETPDGNEPEAAGEATSGLQAEGAGDAGGEKTEPQ